jgi:ApbE superfamily uncharacterized protein (UPF0280 family)
MRQQARRLADGRLHLQDGPIDLIIGADGTAETIERAYGAAARRFAAILDELCAELPLLRRHAEVLQAPRGVVAQRMWRAVLPFAKNHFITPMAAVAGSVAEEVLGAMTADGDLRKAYVNNGGDIALFLSPCETFAIGMIDRPDRPHVYGTMRLRAEQGVCGVATSGWRGRSFSLGIADAVTVLAETASMADAAATIIANAVDLPGCPGIRRKPANELDLQSDLGDRAVTVDVGSLTEAEIDRALRAGARVAESCRHSRLIHAAVLHLQGRSLQVDGGARLTAAA